jgi:hypothetical protein
MSTSISIVEYDEISSQIDTVKETANFLPDVSTDEGYQKSKRVSLDIGKLLTALEKTRKEQKAHFIEGGRQVDIQAKSIVAKLEEIQIPHKEAYKELDNLKKQREEDRKSNIRDKIESIRLASEGLEDSTSTDIINIIENLNKDSDFDFEEFTTGAKQAVEDTLKTLNKMQSRKEKEENDAIELAKLKKENEAREKKEREDKIARDAAAKAEEEKKEAIKREEKAKDQARQAKIAAKEAEEAKIKAEADAKIASEKAKKDAEDAKEQAAKEAEEAAKRAREDEIKKQEEAVKFEAEEVAKRESNKKHIGKIRREAKDCLIACGLSEEIAKEVVLAIHKGNIKNVQIKY